MSFENEQIQVSFKIVRKVKKLNNVEKYNINRLMIDEWPSFVKIILEYREKKKGKRS